MAGFGIGALAIGSCRAVALPPDVFRGRIYFLSGIFDKSAASVAVFDKNLPLAGVFDKDAVIFLSVTNEV